MFIVIYFFQVKPTQEKIFEKAWHDLTQLIYEYEGSLGSRLHFQKESNYIGYAQWPDKITWENSGKKLPEEANQIRKTMKEACKKIETVYEMEVVDDLLQPKFLN